MRLLLICVLLLLPTYAKAVTVDRTTVIDAISGPLAGTSFTLTYSFPLIVGPYGYYKQLNSSDFFRAELTVGGTTYTAYEAQLITTGGAVAPPVPTVAAVQALEPYLFFSGVPSYELVQYDAGSLYFYPTVGPDMYLFCRIDAVCSDSVVFRDLTTVPVPASLVGGGFGLIAFAWIANRRRKRRAPTIA